MSPEVLLALVVVAISPESTETKTSTGQSFVVIFPENIAYYYPEEPQNKVYVTALYDNTQVIVKSYTYQTITNRLRAGETRDFSVNDKLELRRSKNSTRTLQITSTKSVTVQAVSMKTTSVQTALVLPTDKLSTEYLIPPVPQIQGTSIPADIVTASVTERGPFRVIVVNTDQPNIVTLEGAESTDLLFEPLQSTQILLNTADTLRSVKSDQPVAVLFGHTCAIKYNCTCGMLYAQLPPARKDQLKFFIPPVVSEAVDETFVLVSEEGSTRVEAFDPDSPLVETTGTAILYRPSLLLPLIPESDFANCYVVNFIPNMENFAVILVHKDLTDGVHIGSHPPDNPAWQTLTGTDYVSTRLVLTSSKKVIWHNSAKIAVYFIGENTNTLFGNPAAVVSETSAKLQRHIYQKIEDVKEGGVQKAWIGMRRSSLTGEWYWLNQDPVNDTNWDEGEPGAVDDGQCVAMSVESSKDFSWRDEDCCQAINPICYRGPVLFPP